jgi:hypothetical protein
MSQNDPDLIQQLEKAREPEEAAKEAKVLKDKIPNKKNPFEKILDNIDNGRLEALLAAYKISPYFATLALNTFTDIKLSVSDAPPLQRQSSIKKSIIEKYPDCKEAFQILECTIKDNWITFIIYLFNMNNLDVTTPVNKTRIKKIYKILTNYFIGGPDLSERAQQVMFKDKYISIHEELFYEEPSRWSWFGGKGGKQTRKNKRTRKSKGLYRG